ncbi:hypothetical protein AB0E74_27130 [Streptomyces sp. NPDC030392]|uniref:hypothetical protein n=1 Tax=Streptomyces sp. NPDC030392 TaxID=3155468 RepID=UPI0033F776A1
MASSSSTARAPSGTGLMAPLPWMRAVGTSRVSGLHRCLRAMLHPGMADFEDCDDPWS